MRKSTKKLSIIIPCWNAEPYINELLDCLNAQINSKVEVIVVDDGSNVPFKTSYKWCKVVRKSNGGCSTARNKGLDLAKGEYVQFIDADDIVADDFIDRVFEKIDSDKPDVIEFSWKSLSKEGTQHDKKLNDDGDRLNNPSVCTRCFKRSFIGDVRFNEQKDSTEDEDFSRKMGYLIDGDFTRSVIPEYMYFYRTAVTDSKVKRFKKGLMKTKRIVYYYKHATKDMGWLLDEIKKEDEVNEVWLLTEQNDIPELKRYCQVSVPIGIWAHYLRGESYSRCTLMPVPFRTQVVLYCEYANKVGGIQTAMYNFCQNMKEYYDIVFMYDSLDSIQINRFSKVVKTLKNDPSQTVVCDTIILNRLTDKIPKNISYKKSVQICHACKQRIMTIPQDRDVLVNVSQAAKDSWEDQAKNGIVIHNMSYMDKRDSLFLVSATRIGASDKHGNEERMRKLAYMLCDNRIPYIWLNFSDNELENMPNNFVNMPCTLDTQCYIQRADYLVQLSGVEAYSMSILEALTNNTAILACGFPSLFEQGFVDGVHGYVVPFDMDFDIHDILNVPKFDFKYDNESIIGQWREILGDTTPLKNYVPPTEDVMSRVQVKQFYRDMDLDRYVNVGEILNVTPERAEELTKLKLAVRL